jgi:hypothetical protein
MMTDQLLSKQDLAAIKARVREYHGVRLGMTVTDHSSYAELASTAAGDAERLLREVRRLRAELAKRQP